jgi:hypothetical protein
MASAALPPANRNSRQTSPNQSPWLVGTFIVVAISVVGGLLIGRYFEVWSRVGVGYWMWVGALIPAALIAQHALFVIFIKRVTINAELVGRRPTPPDQRLGGEPRKRQESYKTRMDLGPALANAVSQNESYFDPLQVGLQYILSTILIAVIGPTLVYVCCDPPSCLLGKLTEHPRNVAIEPEEHNTGAPVAAGAANKAKIKENGSKDGKQDRQPPVAAAAQGGDMGPPKRPSGTAATSPPLEIAHTPYVDAFRLGAAGAFIYVLTYLGRRNFQRDITVPAALWSSVQLVLGPTLAYTIAYFLVPSSKPSEGMIDFAAIYFLAGLSPRLIADWINSTVQRVWLSSGSTTVAARPIPLTQVRGITPSVESRLGEEGIEDVAQLAMANPVKLLRNTPFDPRQIFAWIDEAILIRTLPDHWSALEKEGITGAMDLAWYLLGDGEQAGEGPAPIDGRTALTKLAGSIKIDADALYHVALRLLYDDQVEMVWAMYESNGGEQG